jgi:hypothetical protein
VLDRVDLDRRTVYGALQRIGNSWERAPGTDDVVLNDLVRTGLLESVAALRGRLI